MTSRNLYLAAILVWAAYCLYLGWEGVDLAFVSMGAGPFPHPILLASANFAIGAAALAISAKRVRWWSLYLLLYLSLVGIMWAGSGAQFGLPIHSVLISAFAGLAFLVLAVIQVRLARKPAD